MRNTGKTSRAQESETRFEFARKHIATGNRLSQKSQEAYDALYAWEYPNGKFAAFRSYPNPKRKPRTPEEREELKRLQAAYTDARANLLLHENDGRNI